ncbi:MAG: rod shape-determining protein MreC [Ruminococcaceae bacterium]|nr:rod shape-determining protein MreC [Oscillospiraceae bacterium]
MKIFKNKFFIIALSLAIFFVILMSVLSLMGQMGAIKNAMNTISMPFRSVGNKISEAFDGFSKYFTSMDSLIDENESLKSEIDRLEGELADADATKDENARLREYLETKKTYPDFKMIDALIVGREGDNNTTFFTLDRGQSDGVTVGMPIIVTGGVVGSVCEVGNNWCRVRVLTESSAGMGAYVDRSGEIGIVNGDVTLGMSNSCRLNYLSENADVIVGDLVYTSGLGSVYPRGLLIGRVSSVGVDEFKRQKSVVIEAAVDIESLRYVMIITDFSSYTQVETEVP